MSMPIFKNPLYLFSGGFLFCIPFLFNPVCRQAGVQSTEIFTQRTLRVLYTIKKL